MILALNKEMQIAQRMQQALMPSAEVQAGIAAQMGITIASHFSCSAELGGDFWGCKMLSDEELAIYLCDFSGHGVAAAINTFRFHALLEHQLESYGRDPSLFMGMLNQQMHSLLQRDQFATAFYGILHLGLDTLFYVGAGSPPPLLIHEDGTSAWVDSAGLPVGINPQHHYPLQEITFDKNSMLLCYSDCLIEQPTQTGALLTAPEIANLAQHHRASAEGLQQALLQPFRDANHHLPDFADDLTITIYQRNG
jgi:sigma-B regulation protein RsbU (phosphoserine phosphatase)